MLLINFILMCILLETFLVTIHLQVRVIWNSLVFRRS